jgi:Putative peptidoglycan binding domain
VRELRTKGRRLAGTGGGATAAVAAVGFRLWSSAAQRPVDASALVCAIAASLIIVVNAVFLQSGAHPAPFFANPTVQTSASRQSAISSGVPAAQPIRTIDMAPARSAPAGRTQAAASARRNDPIGDLIGSPQAPTATVAGPARVAAVQRALSEYGYGQLRLSGTIDEPTSAAIQKFEADHKLPVTGRLSDRLLSELSAMTGHPIP